MEKISVVIPVYNSEHSIKNLVNRLIKVFEAHHQLYELILVDDCSKMDTRKVLETIGDQRVKVFFLEENVGQQAALKYGMIKSSGDYVITLDDDLEQQPEDIFILINEIKKGFDVVYGIAQRDGYAFHRQFGSNLVDLFFTVFLKKPRKIRVGCFRIMNRTVVDYIINDRTSFVYLSAIILKFTQNISNVTVTYQKRPYGKSNYNFKKLCKLYLNLLYYYGIKNGN
ncbi:glycosyltransferase [Eubacteriaceae bacterium ES2]|nr:glycosyltransferase [Eubacteriaceae bacterium ES2]